MGLFDNIFGKKAPSWMTPEEAAALKIKVEQLEKDVEKHSGLLKQTDEKIRERAKADIERVEANIASLDSILNTQSRDKLDRRQRAQLSQLTRINNTLGGIDDTPRRENTLYEPEGKAWEKYSSTMDGQFYRLPFENYEDATDFVEKLNGQGISHEIKIYGNRSYVHVPESVFEKEFPEIVRRMTSAASSTPVTTEVQKPTDIFMQEEGGSKPVQANIPRDGWFPTTSTQEAGAAVYRRQIGTNVNTADKLVEELFKEGINAKVIIKDRTSDGTRFYFVETTETDLFEQKFPQINIRANNNPTKSTAVPSDAPEMQQQKSQQQQGRPPVNLLPLRRNKTLLQKLVKPNRLISQHKKKLGILRKQQQ